MSAPIPVAEIRPLVRSHHGDDFVDDYEWLRDKDDPEVIAYLEGQNAFVEQETAHLAQLRSNGLLLDRRQGQWVYYRLNPDLPDWVHEILQVTCKANADWLKDNASRLQKMDGRPVREAACC